LAAPLQSRAKSAVDATADSDRKSSGDASKDPPPASGDGNQRGEMAVAVAQLQGFNAACARDHNFIEHVSSAGGESGIAILLPPTVQRLESRF
jgi:hypothetical protein